MLCIGCSKKSDRVKDIIEEDVIKIDFDYDYEDDIRADIEKVVTNGKSIQEELENVEKIIKKYEPIVNKASSQIEMNRASKWAYVVWDTELESLISRIDDKEILDEQENWVSVQEEVKLIALGPKEENGSMYTSLENDFLSEITRTRVYVLGSKLADKNGESFNMPEKSSKYGLFIDNQRTGEVYSSLLIQERWNGGDEAILSIYRVGELEGVITENGDGELEFTSNDGTIKGEITIDRWNSAKLKVIEASGNSIISLGEEIEFGFMIR